MCSRSKYAVDNVFVLPMRASPVRTIAAAVSPMPDLLAVGALRPALAAPTTQQFSVVLANGASCASIGARIFNVPNVVRADCCRCQGHQSAQARSRMFHPMHLLTPRFVSVLVIIGGDTGA